MKKNHRHGFNFLKICIAKSCALADEVIIIFFFFMFFSLFFLLREKKLEYFEKKKNIKENISATYKNL